MTELSGLERRYRRLLAWYPRAFRELYAEEMITVMMASASQGQERPRARESLNVLRNAIRAWLRPVRAQGTNPPLQDGLALFSLLAPAFLVLVAALEVAFPFHLPASPFLFLHNVQVGGLAMLHQSGFDVAAGSLLLVAIFAALGMRWLTLVAAGLAVLYAVVLYTATFNGYGLPLPLEMLATGGLLLEVVALIASPGPRRGRELVRWQHAVVLVLAAAAVHVSTIVVSRTGFLPLFLRAARPSATGYLLVAVLLIAAAAALATVFRLNGYLLLLLAAMLYPWVVQVVTSAFGGSVLIPRMWIAVPSTMVPLLYLYLPPVLLACAIAARVIRSRRARPEPA
jgi:hypothetical protein